MISKEVFDVICYSCSAHEYRGDGTCQRIDNETAKCHYDICPKWHREIKKDPPLTPEEFMNKMAELHKKYSIEQDDEEMAHGHMDELICELLINLGYEDGIRVFYATPKWYA